MERKQEKELFDWMRSLEKESRELNNMLDSKQQEIDSLLLKSKTCSYTELAQNLGAAQNIAWEMSAIEKQLQWNKLTLEELEKQMSLM